MPGDWWQGQNEFGDYCLLKNKVSIARKEAVHSKKNRLVGRSCYTLTSCCVLTTIFRRPSDSAGFMNIL